MAIMDSLTSGLKQGMVYDVYLNAQCDVESRLLTAEMEEEAQRNAPDPAPMPITVGVIHADEIGLARYV
jgi:hypothetical protein